MSSERERMEEVLDSLEKYWCSTHGLNYDSECPECRRNFREWARENKVKVIWIE